MSEFLKKHKEGVPVPFKCEGTSKMTSRGNYHQKTRNVSPSGAEA